MRSTGSIYIVLFAFVLISIPLITPHIQACKDIVATTEATGGDYNLLLKVRDPSREGLQVLCRVPEGTTYTYHYPWTGKPWMFTVTHTCIGVATKGDTLPNIVKAGMVLSDAGIAYGDADTGSNWKNPTKNAWDDFDWIRYAAEQASTEDQAVSLLTTEAVDRLHASAVSENLFVVGPTKAVVVEADAFHHAVSPIHGILVMSNYPKMLWNTQVAKKLPLAASFETTKERWIMKGQVIRLNSICGVQLIHVGEDNVTARPVPYFVFASSMNQTPEINIPLGQQRLVGPYSVTVQAINGKKAQLSVSTMFKAWETQLLDHITPSIGHITIETMMNLSRLHSQDLNGLRPMCEDRFTYEAVMINKIPTEHAEVLSSGWFSANHACSSIYVPVHICDTDFYEPYKTGDAAALSLELLREYGHGNLTEPFHNIEKVFLLENEVAENIAKLMVEQHLDVSAFLTSFDTGMQEQAYLTEQLWLRLTALPEKKNSSDIRTIIENIWTKDYTTTLKQLRQSIPLLEHHNESMQCIKIINEIIGSIETSQLLLDIVIN